MRDTAATSHSTRGAHSAKASVRVSSVCALSLALVGLMTLAGCDSASAPTVTAAAADGATQASNPQPLRAPIDASALAMANHAFHENRIVAPPGDNALEHTLRALQEDTLDAGANEMLVDITPIAASAIEADINVRNFAEAERVMALLASANPSSLTVQSLQRRLTAATRTQAAEANALAAAAARIDTAQLAAAAAETSTTATLAAPTQPAARTRAPNQNANRSESAASNTIAAATTAPKSDEQRTLAAASPSTKLAAITSEPIATFKVTPTYPPIAKKRRAEGWVELQFMVDANGMPKHVEVVRAEPAGMFDRAAAQALTRWKFKPAEREGKPVETRAKTTIAFKLG